MRIALIADIHGNLMALEAVLAELDNESVDQIVCLGDVAIFGPQPCETLARLRQLGCPVVMGNTDAWALDPQPHPVRDENTVYFNEIELWGAAQLSDEDRALIRAFQPTVSVDLGHGTTLLCYHGSPRSYHDSIVATTPDEELALFFGNSPAALMAGGHTHTPFVRRFQQSIVLNPGSVGLPYERLPGGGARNPPWAEYGILMVDRADVRIELRRTPVDTAQLAQAVRQSGMPHADWWLADWQG
jgi:predicted phosphodiesterase